MLRAIRLKLLALVLVCVLGLALATVRMTRTASPITAGDWHPLLIEDPLMAEYVVLKTPTFTTRIACYRWVTEQQPIYLGALACTVLR
jgi:hypothetical protein